jgi:hypothetical protein
MPKLPDATDLSRVGFDAVRPFVQIPDVNIEGAYNRLATGISNLGTGFERLGNKVEDANQRAERFRTKLGLVKSEKDYTERTKSLDPKDPNYVTKKKTARREAFAPVLTSVVDPQNKMAFDTETERDYIAISKKAEADRRIAMKQQTKDDLLFYAASLEEKIANGKFNGNAAEEIRSMVDDSPDLDDDEKNMLASDLVPRVGRSSLLSTAKNYIQNGVALTPELRRAISDLEDGSDAPVWLGGFLARTATLESRGGIRNEDPEDADRIGPYKLDPAAIKVAGLEPNDRLDASASTEGAARLALSNYGELNSALGREPTMSELYIAHKSGVSNTIKLLQNPDAPAADIVGDDVIEKNGGWAAMTAGQLAAIMDLRYDGENATDDPDDIREALSTDPAFASLDSREIERIVNSSLEFGSAGGSPQDEAIEAQRRSIFNEFAELDTSGDLNQDWVRAQADSGLLSAREVRLFSNAVANRDRVIADAPDQVASIARLVNVASNESDLSEARSALDEAYADGMVSNRTKKRLLAGMKARSATLNGDSDAVTRSEGLISRMVRSRDYSSGNSVDDEMAELTARMTLQDWRERNPKATDVEILAEAQKIGKATAMDRVETARNSLDLPSGLAGVNRRSIDRESIYKYAAKLQQSRPKPGRYEEYMRDVALLKKWLEIIDIQEMVV